MIDTDTPMLVHSASLDRFDGCDYDQMDKLIEVTNRRIARFYAKYTPYSAEEWMELLKTGEDLEFSPENAVLAGLASCTF